MSSPPSSSSFPSIKSESLSEPSESDAIAALEAAVAAATKKVDSRNNNNNSGSNNNNRRFDSNRRWDNNQNDGNRDQQHSRQNNTTTNNSRNFNTPSSSASSNSSSSSSSASTAPASSAAPVANKITPNFSLSGKLAAHAAMTTGAGIVATVATNNTAGGGDNGQKNATLTQTIYVEPADSCLPPTDPLWRFYIFKDGSPLKDELNPTQNAKPLKLQMQNYFLCGRDTERADIVVLHPSCSKLHAVVQFRRISKTSEIDGSITTEIKPYLFDLDSTNGTWLLKKKCDARRYYELRENDTIRFGESSREYVLIKG